MGQTAGLWGGERYGEVLLKHAHSLGQIARGGASGKHWADGQAAGEDILLVYERTLAKVNKQQIQQHADATAKALGIGNGLSVRFG